MAIEQNQIGEWIDRLASKAPVPGGGGASAVSGALAAALGQMVANLTVGKKRYADVEEDMVADIAELSRLQAEMLAFVERDAEVFAPLAQAYGMPKETPEQIEVRERVMEERLLDASLVPLAIMEKAIEILEIVDELEIKGSRMAVSDAGVAAQLARAAVGGAVMNVYINTKSMKNREKAEELNEKAARLTRKGFDQADAIYERVQKKCRK
ncbi:MAG: cyclodeaminase/cyclohydrolase family protein [Clostridiales bacterium]|nr:cyclodeaminase/cyclohydrolase family protein [Clostridiales bacterium]